MTEQQLRDVLARVVPEPPDSIAEAAPVVRVARRRRRGRVAGVSALAAVLVAGTAIGVQRLQTDDRTVVADHPTIPDPYTTAPCPDATRPWADGSVADLGSVMAVRFCARDVKGADGADGPRDALVVDVSSFSDAVRALAPEDPARCAAYGPQPTDTRILFELTDGTVVGVPAGFCQDAEIEGRTLDGSDLIAPLLGALRAQRDAHAYAQPDPEPATCVFGASDIAPAQGGHDRLVAGTVCSRDLPRDLSPSEMDVLQRAWASATKESGDTSTCTPQGHDVPVLFVRTDRGDNLQLDVGCDDLTFMDWAGNLYRLDLSIDELLA